MSIVTKYGAPTVLVAALPFLFQAVIRNDHLGLAPLVLWSALFVFMVWWVIPIKEVSLRDEVFVIGDFRKTIEVPVSHLASIHENRWNRTPNIVLIFHPPTPFGRKVRLLTPSALLGGEFDRVAEVLRGVMGRKGV